MPQGERMRLGGETQPADEQDNDFIVAHAKRLALRLAFFRRRRGARISPVSMPSGMTGVCTGQRNFPPKRWLRYSRINVPQILHRIANGFRRADQRIAGIGSAPCIIRRPRGRCARRSWYARGRRRHSRAPAIAAAAIQIGNQADRAGTGRRCFSRFVADGADRGRRSAPGSSPAAVCQLLEMLEARHVGRAADKLFRAAVAKLGRQKILHRDIEAENFAFALARSGPRILDANGHGGNLFAFWRPAKAYTKPGGYDRKTVPSGGGSSNGRTTDSDSVYRGSNRRPPNQLV